jgi:hypothetical protein
LLTAHLCSSKLAERKLVVTKASQALALLEKGVMDASNVLGEEDDDDGWDDNEDDDEEGWGYGVGYGGGVY